MVRFLRHLIRNQTLVATKVKPLDHIVEILLCICSDSKIFSGGVCLVIVFQNRCKFLDEFYSLSQASRIEEIEDVKILVKAVLQHRARQSEPTPAGKARQRLRPQTLVVLDIVHLLLAEQQLVAKETLTSPVPGFFLSLIL